MQSKKWRVIICCCIIIYLTFSISCERTSIKDKGGDMNIKNIEIILDHKLSREDLKAYNPDKLTREEYIKECYSHDLETAQDEAYEEIYYYYLYNKDDEKTAQKYFDKLSKERQEKIQKANEDWENQNHDIVEFEGIDF